MEYQVPQFIEVENRIVGPLTLKQFIYLAGTAGLCAVFLRFLPLIVAIVLSIPVVALGVSLAFYKMNGKPFIEVVEAAFNYLVGAKLFLWKRGGGDAKPEKREEPAALAAAERSARPAPRLTRGRLSELAWSLDVKQGEESAEK